MSRTSSLPALQARVIRIEEEIKGIKGGMEALAKGLDNQSERLYAALSTLSDELSETRNKEAERREVSWPLILTLIGTLASLALIGAALIGMYVSLAVAPVQSTLATYLEQEKKDQAEIAALHARVTEAVTDLKVARAQMQMRAQLANERLQAEERTTSLLWHKVYGTEYPSRSYYPEIAPLP